MYSVSIDNILFDALHLGELVSGSWLSCVLAHCHGSSFFFHLMLFPAVTGQKVQKTKQANS